MMINDDQWWRSWWCQWWWWPKLEEQSWYKYKQLHPDSSWLVKVQIARTLMVHLLEMRTFLLYLFTSIRIYVFKGVWNCVELLDASPFELVRKQVLKRLPAFTHGNYWWVTFNSHGPKNDTQEPPRSLQPPFKSIEPYLPAPMSHQKQHGPSVQAQRDQTHF